MENALWDGIGTMHWSQHLMLRSNARIISSITSMYKNQYTNVSFKARIT
jgi:hypothetical protein